MLSTKANLNNKIHEVGIEWILLTNKLETFMILINSKIHKVSILIQKEIENMNRPKNVTEMEMIAKDFLSTLSPNKPGTLYTFLKKEKRNVK